MAVFSRITVPADISDKKHKSRNSLLIRQKIRLFIGTNPGTCRRKLQFLVDLELRTAGMPQLLEELDYEDQN